MFSLASTIVYKGKACWQCVPCTPAGGSACTIATAHAEPCRACPAALSCIHPGAEGSQRHSSGRQRSICCLAATHAPAPSSAARAAACLSPCGAAGHACTLELRAARDIVVGEPLTISYLN